MDGRTPYREVMESCACQRIRSASSMVKKPPPLRPSSTTGLAEKLKQPNSTVEAEKLAGRPDRHQHAFAGFKGSFDPATGRPSPKALSRAAGRPLAGTRGKRGDLSLEYRASDRLGPQPRAWRRMSVRVGVRAPSTPQRAGR